MTRVISGAWGKHLGKRDRPGLGAGPGGEGRPGLGTAAGGSHQDHFFLQLLHISLLFFPLHFSSLPHLGPPFKSWAWVQLLRGHGPLLPPAPHGPPWRRQTQLSCGEGGPECGGDGGSAQREVGGRVARWGRGGGAEAGGGSREGRAERRRVAGPGTGWGQPCLGEQVQMPSASGGSGEEAPAQALRAPWQPPALWSQRPQDSSGPEPLAGLAGHRGGFRHRVRASA